MKRLIPVNVFLFIIHSSVYGSLAFDPLSHNTFSNDIHESVKTFDEAKKKCDSVSHCAGVSEYYKGSENETDHLQLVEHSFLPNLPKNTYQSSKSFTLHRGRVTRGSVLSLGHEQITVDEAKEYCRFHPNCVAFFYPVHSLQLTAPDNITFVSSLNLFDPSPSMLIHDWYTFIANDLNKAMHVNASSIDHDADFVQNPFPKCCDRTELPSKEDIEAVDTMERISCDMPREEFMEKYEMQRKPVILVGCDKHWKALKRWTYDGLITRFGNDTGWRTHLGTTELHDAIPWKTIVDSMTSKSSFYIFDQLDRAHGKVLEEDYSTPSPLEGADLYASAKQRKDFPSKDYGSMRWWCVSSGYSGTHPHMDPIVTDAWNSLVKGHKWWIIFPDSIVEDQEDILECDDSCSVKDYSAVHWYATTGVNAARLEYTGNHRNQRPLHILQHPGETIYVPYGRIHSVYNLDPNIAVTANFGSIGNFDKVWEEIVTSGNPQHWQRLYYQEFDIKLRKLARNTSFWPASDYSFKTEDDNDKEDDDDDDDDDKDDDDDDKDDDDDDKGDDDDDKGDDDDDKGDDDDDKGDDDDDKGNDDDDKGDDDDDEENTVESGDDTDNEYEEGIEYDDVESNEDYDDE